RLRKFPGDRPKRPVAAAAKCAGLTRHARYVSVEREVSFYLSFYQGARDCSRRAIRGNCRQLFRLRRRGQLRPTQRRTARESSRLSDQRLMQYWSRKIAFAAFVAFVQAACSRLAQQAVERLTLAQAIDPR